MFKQAKKIRNKSETNPNIRNKSGLIGHDLADTHGCDAVESGNNNGRATISVMSSVESLSHAHNSNSLTNGGLSPTFISLGSSTNDSPVDPLQPITSTANPSDDGSGEGHPALVTPTGRADPATITSIQELQVQRIACVKMQLRINNQCRALVRRALGWRMDLDEKALKKINAEAKAIVDAIQNGEPVPPEHQHIAAAIGAFCVRSKEAVKPFDSFRKHIEAELTALAKSLPVYPWVENTPGLGAIGLAVIVGEAGDLSKYANPAKLWKRLGLAVFNGKSQRKCSDAAEAIRQGYNPRRRSAIWTIADSLMKTDGPYREVYKARKIYELANHPEFDKGIDKKTGKQKVTLHCHRRCTRYAEKRMVRDLWRAWRDQGFDDTHCGFAEPSLAMA